MNVLLFGVSNVEKSTVGELLARHLDFSFYDLDDEIKNRLHTTLEIFVTTGTLYERDFTRCEVMKQLLALPGDKVIAVTPLSI